MRKAKLVEVMICGILSLSVFLGATHKKADEAFSAAMQAKVELEEKVIH